MSSFSVDWLRKASLAEGTQLDEDYSNVPGVNLNPVDKHTVSIVSPIEADDDEDGDAFSKEFLYSRDYLLGCFKELSIDKSLMLEDLYQEESLKPVSLEPLTPQEQEIYDSGAFNSEITRKYGNKGNRRGGGANTGGRGGGGQRRNNNNRHGHGHGGAHHGNFRSPTSPNEDSLREDIWDLPTNVQGSFANGAFMVGGSSAGSAAGGGHQEHSWKRVSQQQQQQQQQQQVSPLWDTPQHHHQQQQQQEPVWFYKDPQQNVQGPFLGREMQQWFEAGYFPPNLLVRQQTDLHFEPLEVYMKQRFNGLVTFLRSFPDVSAVAPVQQQQPQQQQAWTTKYQWNTQEITWIQQQMAQNLHMKQIDIEEYLMMEKERAMQLQQQQQQQQNFKPAPAPKTNAWGASKQSPISPVMDTFVTEKMEKLAVKESVPAAAPATAAVVSPKESKPAPWVGSSPAAKKLSLAEIQKQEAEEVKKNVSNGTPKPAGGNPWNNKAAAASAVEKQSASAVSSSVEAEKENLAAWIKTKLRPLDGKMDLVSFVEVLLPLNDPYTINEIVHDGIGQNFTLVNPHRLVTEFLEKKHAAGLIKGPLSVPAPPTHSAYALHLRKSSAGDDHATSSSQGSQGGFVPVQSKKTKKAASAKSKENKAAPVVGAHGKIVPGAVKKA